MFIYLFLGLEQLVIPLGYFIRKYFFVNMEQFNKITSLETKLFPIQNQNN